MSFAKRSKTGLKSVLPYRVSSEVTSDAIAEYLQSLDCPRSLAVLLLFRNGEHKQIADLEIDPLDYLTAEEFGDAYAATKFLSKFKGLTLDYDLDDVALQKFMKYEDLCMQTNSRFRDLGRDPKYKGRCVWLHNAVRRKISQILGDYRAEEFFASADWGPGATTLLTAREASATNKFQREAGITRDLYSLLPDGLLSEVYPLWHPHLLEIGFPHFQVGNKVVTVPKDASTNRVIAIEPGINLWFQKSIGSMLEKRLKRYAVDLRRQEINQHFAYLGSKESELATVDFSSASDSISLEVIRELLPPRWFLLLDSARSHYGTLDGKQLKWNKFSSMGNGFTFQLESLIFFAVAKCCVEYLQLKDNLSTVSVYGDDVIVPVRCLELFSEVSAFYGFILNEKKSHSSSPFRESCGAHYFSGVDVKPYYLKDSLSDASSVFRMANSIRRHAHRRMLYLGCDARFRVLFYRLMKLVPKSLRLKIPATLGDGGFIVNFDEATPARARHGIEGYFVENLVSSSKTRESDEFGLLLARLWVASSQEERNTVPLRGRTRLRRTRSLVYQWYDLGPWI